jgi:DNA (cytosine-5)-methyltransferase 1
MSSGMPREYIPFPSTDPLILLSRVRQRFTQRELAPRFGVSAKTIGRWERKETECPPFIVPMLREILREGQRPAGPSTFTFIDLFAGIGGIRKGFEQAGGRCVFTSEWNDWARKTYLANFQDEHKVVGDIRPFTEAGAVDIPDHDVLLAGFPCQPFSIAGVSKKNALGRPHGFECMTQGTLFFDVAKIIEAKRPKAFLLENVKNLVSHDKGNTFRVIKQTLQDELGYHIQAQVIDGQSFVPQHRERILIAGFAEQTGFSFKDFRAPAIGPRLKTILHPEDGTEDPEDPYTLGRNAKVNEKYILTDKLWAYLQGYAAKHKAAGNGFGFGLVTGESVSRTLSARYYKDGSEILVSRGKGKNPRRLTPRECARLMGYEDFVIPVSDTQAYKQFGNSVIVPVMAETARIMEPHIRALKEYDELGVYQAPLLTAARI